MAIVLGPVQSDSTGGHHRNAWTSVDVLLTAVHWFRMKVRGDLELVEIEQLLDEITAPVRIACHTPGDRLWMLSLWFRYRDGGLHCATSKQADVVRYLEYDEQVAFEVSTNDPPYRGVRGRGTASLQDDPEKALLRALLDRYLGDTKTPLGNRLLGEEREEVTISIDPAVVFGWDFTDRMQTETARR